MRLLLSPILRWRSWGIERLSNLSKTTEPGSRTASVQTQAICWHILWPWKVCYIASLLTLYSFHAIDLLPPTLSQPNFSKELFILYGCISSYASHPLTHYNPELSYMSLPRLLVLANICNEFQSVSGYPTYLHYQSIQGKGLLLPHSLLLVSVVPHILPLFHPCFCSFLLSLPC